MRLGPKTCTSILGQLKRHRVDVLEAVREVPSGICDGKARPSWTLLKASKRMKTHDSMLRCWSEARNGEAICEVRRAYIQKGATKI